MAYHLQVPARINILGNPGDANEGDFATISAAINIFAHGRISKSENIYLEQKKRTDDGFDTCHALKYQIDQIPLPYDGKLDLLKGGINRLFSHSPEFRRKIKKHGFQFSTWTDVPRQSGLGGSSLFVILVLSGLRALYNLDPLMHNDYFLAELTQRVEVKELRITAGYADRYVPLFGGIAYLDFRGKIHQKEINMEPYATYERLDQWGDDLPLVFISSGVRRNSGDVHGKMRPLYIQEYDRWVKDGGDPPAMVQFMKAAWETAWQGKIAMLNRNWATFGQLMNINHNAVDNMMTYCGFPDGAGKTNNLLIECALANGGFGAKLTGAGDGGSVFAVTEPGNTENLMSAWKNEANKAGLTNARVFKPQIVKHGLLIDED